jgi:glucose/arabinose dehydrogenase|tara:strand:+ start:25 stop:801 length:777 start_codon:yes stop_codon:yes gene_type:complete
MSSEFNLYYLIFSDFFSYKECVNTNLLAHSGGRMVFFKNGKILLTIGDWTWAEMLLAQDKNSIFGKIISIDLKSKDYEIISMGSRNAQGLYYDKNKNVIIHTEHGPIGGDEININFNPDNKIVENYGWPISSYGEHDDGKFRKEAPLHKSHKDYGFIEPIKYYTPSIAISEITKIPITFNEKFTNDFFVGALGYKWQLDEGDQSIHHIRFNENFSEIIFEDIIPIGERIRDMIFIKENNTILTVLESIPAIGVIKIIN